MKKKLQKFWNKACKEVVFVFVFSTMKSVIADSDLTCTGGHEVVFARTQVSFVTISDFKDRRSCSDLIGKKMLQEKGQRKKPSEQLPVQHNILH